MAELRRQTELPFFPKHMSAAAVHSLRTTLIASNTNQQRRTVMRKWMFGLFAAAGIAAAPLQAQDELFGKLDANKDGFITLDEVDGEAKAKLERLLRTSDKDEDKKLSKDEFAAGLKQPETPRTPVEGAEGRRPSGAPGQDPKEFFARADANKDGKLSKDEAPERLKD